MRILYISVHEVLEYDELRMLTREGHSVFGIRAFTDPSTQGVLRLPEEKCKNRGMFQEFERSGCSISDRILTGSFLRNFDVAILMHDPSWFVRNVEAFGDLPVVVRTVGQSVPSFERLYRELGERIKIVRYSSREIGLEGFAKTDAVIYFGKYKADFLPWNGKGEGLTFHNNYLLREQSSLPRIDWWRAFREATGSALWGVGNERLAGASGVAPPERMARLLADAPWYFYVYSYPPSYTLSLMEAMFAGVPVIAPSVSLAERSYSASMNVAWTASRYEIPEIIADCGVLYDTIDEATAAAARISSDRDFASKLSANARAAAAKRFDAEVIAPQWTRFLSTVT
jgi:glycosyltransferase involved in cell wall biosynthesis